MLILDPKNHTYTWDGQKVLGVSEILERAGLADKSWVSLYGLERGIAIHLATAYSDAGSLDESTVDPAVQPFLAAWRAFRRDIPTPILARERGYYDPAHGYAGTIDCVLGVPAAAWLLDLKTNTPPSYAPLQIGAYWNLLRANQIEVADCFTLALKPDGSYRLRKVDHVKGWAKFYEALQKVRAMT